MISHLPLFKNKSAPEARPAEALVFVTGDKTYPVKLRRMTRAKRLTLRVEPTGDIHLSVPLRCSTRRMNAFLDQHRAWVIEQIDAVPSPVPFTAGGKIPFRGVPYLVAHNGEMRGLVRAENGVLHVAGNAAHLPRRLRDFLKKEAKKDFEAAVARYAAALGVKISKIQIRDTKTRWGSCSTEGVLCFSWRLIFAPPLVLDYLAAHEVAHMKIMDHSPRFWALVEQLCADTPQARKWLKANGNMLLAIG